MRTAVRVYLKRLQSKFPDSLKQWAQIAYHALPPQWRYGQEYRRARSLFEKSDWWDTEALTEYQECRLRLLIRHCYDHVPYYRRIFRERGLSPDDIQTVPDLAKLPFLTKDVVRLRRQELMADNIPIGSMDRCHTSGSSGAPLTFFMDRTTRPVERALAMRRLLWLGYGDEDVTAFFSGLPLANPRHHVRYFPGSRQLRISFHQVNEKSLDEMLDALEHYGPDFIDAWPSCLYILARWMDKRGRRIRPPRYIVTASENLYPHMKEAIENTFGSTVIDWYGQEENVAVAMQCSYAREYHVQMEMGILELIQNGSEPTGEIVGTCLHNLAMPLLRYRTGDRAVKGSGEPCPCGRKHPTLARVLGRDTELVLVPDGRAISPLILHFAFHNLEEIRQAQIIQEDIKTLRVKVVPWDKLSENTCKTLVNEIHARLEAPSVSVIVEQAEEIPRTKGGKRPFVVTKLKTEDYL